MNLDDKIAELRRGAEQQRGKQSTGQASPLKAVKENPLSIASEIIKRDRANRAITEGCIKQIMKDIDDGETDYKKLLLYAAEALDRATGGGDGYFKRLSFHMEQREEQGQAPTP